MDELELLALLTGVRKTPIFVCHVSTRLRLILRASTTHVLLSPETVRKQEAKHRGSSADLYRLAPTIIASEFVRFDAENRRVICIWHAPKNELGKVKSYKAVVKATRTGHELFLMSVHRVDKTSVRSVFKRTLSLDDWERKSGVR